MECMPSENELTAALMRLCDGPDDHARLHMQARANHGHVVTLDCDYDAEGLTATFIEQAADAPKSQRILTAMRADTPSASAARRIARIAPIVLPESQLGIAPPVRVAASAEDPCAFELHSADAHAAPNAALLRFHGTAANGFSCATMWRLEDGYASYAMVDYTAGPLNDILVDVLCTLRFYAVRGWA